MQNNGNKNGEIVIDLGQMVKALWRHILIIVVAAEVCALAMFAATYLFVSPKYSATAKMYVNNSSFVFGNVNYSISNSEITASTNLVNTYTEILNSRITLEEVIKVGELPYTYSEISKMITTDVVEDTAVFSVKVTCDNPTDAELIANTIAKVLPDRIADVIDGASVRIVDYAIVPSSRSSPSYTKNTLIGAIAGFILSAGTVAVLEIIATRNDVEIHSAQELTETYPDIPVLASIPDMRRAGKGGYYDAYYSYYGYGPKEDEESKGKNSKSKKKKHDSVKDKQPKLICEDLPYIGVESFKRLRTNVLFSLTDNGSCRVVGITSSQPEDGKSLSAINLAWSMAQLQSKRVLLIDGDLRRPSIHTKLGFAQSPGLSNILSNVGNEPGSSHTYSSKDGTVSFDVISAGDIPPNPSELLGNERMTALIGFLREKYDFIVIDLPPIDAVTDAQAVGSIVDGMIVVVRENFCQRDVLRECIRQLEMAHAKITGFVMNGTGDGTGYGYNKYKYGKYRYYKYSGYYRKY